MWVIGFHGGYYVNIPTQGLTIVIGEPIPLESAVVW